MSMVRERVQDFKVKRSRVIIEGREFDYGGCPLNDTQRKALNISQIKNLREVKMSKWTLEKILACEEIIPGCHFNVDNKGCRFHGKNIIVLKQEGAIKCYNQLHNELILISNPGYDVSNFCFKKIDNTEILPPKNKRKETRSFWAVFYPNNKMVAFDLKEKALEFMGYQGGSISVEYFEREIEVEE